MATNGETIVFVGIGLLINLMIRRVIHYKVGLLQRVCQKVFVCFQSTEEEKERPGYLTNYVEEIGDTRIMLETRSEACLRH